MSCNITLDRHPKKFLEKLAKSAPKEYLRISIFFRERIAKLQKSLFVTQRKIFARF